MSAKALLNEMIELTRAQVDRVIHGDHQALLEGAHQQEALLAALEEAPIDGTPEEMRALYEQLELEKNKLKSLLQTESQRVDFLMRLLLGSPEQKTVGYPKGTGKRKAQGQMLNRKT